MKKGTIVSVVLCCLSVILHVGCGGGSSNTPKVSKLAKRAFVPVVTATALGDSSTIDIIDATKDQFTLFTIPLTVPQATVVRPGASGTTLVFGSNVLDIVDNTKETVSNSNVITLAGPTESMVETSDAKSIYAAVRSTSQVYTIDVANATVNSTSITVPSVRRVALSHNNSKLLAFSDNADTLNVITFSSTDPAGAHTGPSIVSGLDRPFFGVFSSDDSKAYVLNCGPECGGRAASVAVLDMTQDPPTVISTLPVPAATVALIDSGKLYVAGTAVSAGNSTGIGQLTIIDLGSFTPVGNPIQIGNGFHSLLSLATNNKLFVGARTCTTGCLSIVDLSGSAATIATDPGDVTGIAPIPGRNVVYVTVGGELRIYDTTTSKPQANQLDIVGTAAGVVAP